MISHIRQYLHIRRELLRNLHQVHPHPVLRQIKYQLLKRSHLPIITMTVVWGGVVFAVLMSLYSRWGVAVISLLPLLLMIWSSIYIAPWLYRIFEIIKSQYTSNVIDTLGVIPEGRSFVILAICHAVINRSDQLQWLRIMRLTMVFMMSSILLMSLSIVFFQLPSVELGNVIRIFVDIVLLFAMLWLEHQQSILLLYYLPVVLTEKLISSGGMITIAAGYLVMIQFLTGIIPLLFMILGWSALFEDTLWSLTLLFYLCSHELVLFLFFLFDDSHRDMLPLES